MPDHKLKSGIDFIDGINQLGLILDYCVQMEKPVDSAKLTSPAIDVAWFKGENQKFPLFIFEIESSATNSMTYNPMKVFSKKNENFEKPLFFFQIVLEGGQESSRIDDLVQTYGTYNYRIYRVSLNESQNFLHDIIAQHRRIAQNLDITNLIKFLFISKWIDFDLKLLTNHIESLDFEKEWLLNCYISLSSHFTEFIPIASEYLRKIHTDIYSHQNKIRYHTYLGNQWYFPIHLGIIYSSTDDLYFKEKAVKQLIYWQENNSYMTMIGPHFGLNQDYDEFLIWGAGGLFGLLSSLFVDNINLRLYFATQLKKIIYNLKPDFKIPNLLWMLHIIPPNDRSKSIFGFITKEIKSIGSFSVDSLQNPPFLYHDEEFLDSFMNRHDKIFSFQTLMELKAKKPTPDNLLTIKLACTLLTDNNINNELIQNLVKLI